MTFTSEERTTIFKTFRQFVYLFTLVGFIYFIHFLARQFGATVFDENDIVENLQLILLITAGIIFIFQGFCNKTYRPVLFLLASLCFFAMCRELDKVLDVGLPHFIRWRIGFIFPIMALAYVYGYKKKLLKPLFSFLTSPAFYMMSCALVLLIPIAQCIGHGPFIISVLGKNNHSAIKELFEETGETMAYFLIFLSSLECLFLFPAKKN